MSDVQPADHPTGGSAPEAPASGTPPDHLAAALAISADAILSIDAGQRIVYCNDGAERIFGWSRAELVGQSLDVLIPARSRAVHRDHVRAFGESAVSSRLMGHRMKISGVRRDGSEFPADASIVRTDRPEGPVFTVLLRDMSTSQRNALELAERERQLAEAQRLANIGSWDWDVRSGRLTWSDELFRIYGLEPGSVEPTLDAFFERVVPEDREAARQRLQERLARADDFAADERIVRADGAVRHLHSRGKVVRDARGEPARVFGVSQDVTERNEAESQRLLLASERAAHEAAMEANRRLSFLAEASAELASSLDYQVTLRTIARLAVPAVADWCAVDVVDADGGLQRLAVEHQDPEKVQLVQRLEERYPSDPNAPRGAPQVIRTGRAEHVPEIPESLLEEVARDAEHLELIRRLGLRSYMVAPLRTRERILGAITFVYAESGRRYTEDDLRVAEDLARRAGVAMENARLVGELEESRARLEEQATELEHQAVEMEHQAVEMEHQAVEMEAQNEHLQSIAGELTEASRARDDFMATVSHELRTPLNAVIGYAELLMSGVPESIPERSRAQVERIRLSAQHLLQLIDEILTFSRLQAGRGDVDLEAVDLFDVVSEVRAIIEPLAAEQGIEFAVHVDAEPPAMQTDPRKLRQILLNLLGNAVKFTLHGRVELRIRRDGGEVVFEVADTGPGIELADQTLLFEPFWQADQSRTRRAAGVGLGLPITRRFVELLGGRIDVASEIGEGSTFSVRLPLKLELDEGVPPSPGAAAAPE